MTKTVGLSDLLDSRFLAGSDHRQTRLFCFNSHAPLHDSRTISTHATPQTHNLTTMAFLYRPNRIPHYQRLFQRDDGVRQWLKTPRSKYLLTPYFIFLTLGFSGSLYGMTRMLAGKKTYF